MRKFTYIDTESAWDEHLHEGAWQIDSSIQPHHRIGSKRIFAAAPFDVSLGDDGSISCERITSWTEHTHGDEEAVVPGLFDHLRSKPENIACPFGSVAIDLPLLTLAAMEFGLMLPPQLLQRQQNFKQPGPT